MQVLAQLKHIRERRGLSQRDLSERTGVSQATISHLEKGRPSRFITMRKLAEALGVEPGELVGETER